MDIQSDVPLELCTASMALARVNKDGDEIPTMNNIPKKVVRMSCEIETLKLTNSTDGVDSAAIMVLNTRLEIIEDQMNLFILMEERNQSASNNINNVLEDQSFVHNGVSLPHTEAIRRMIVRFKDL